MTTLAPAAPAIEIRVGTADDFTTYVETVEATFGSDVRPETAPDLARILDPGRMFLAYDGSRCVGGASSFAFQLSVPGALLPAAGISNVGVLPTHRRRGILTSLMRRQLDDVTARGEPIAVLWASEAPIYTRFGYGLATLSASFEVQRRVVRFRDAAPSTGSVRLLGEDEAQQLLPPIYDALQREVPGMFSRSDAWWRSEVIADPEHRRAGQGRKFIALLEFGSEPVGYVIYRFQQEWGRTGSNSLLVVRELVALSPAAEAQLWRYVAGVDLIARVRGVFQPVDHPLLLLIDEPRRLELTVGDALWLRIVDLPTALAERGYAGDGGIAFEIEDRFLPANSGRWRLVVEGARARVERTEASADLALAVGDLASTYLGGFTFAQLVRAGRARELSDGAVERADALFRTSRAPWCPQVF